MSTSGNNKSKNAKRREKAREKKLNDLVEERKKHENEHQKVDPVVALKKQLAEAKSNEDHKLAAKLRQDLWVLQDASSGKNIQLESEEIAESMNRLNKVKVNEGLDLRKATSVSKPHKSEEQVSNDSIKNSLDEKSSVEKEVKKMRKKVEQINKLKQKQEEGEDMQQCQLDKLAKEESFLQELKQLEEQLASL